MIDIFRTKCQYTVTLHAAIEAVWSLVTFRVRVTIVAKCIHGWPCTRIAVSHTLLDVTVCIASLFLETNSDNVAHSIILYSI